MSKKTTAAKSVAVSVDEVLKENAKLAGELAKALKQCNEQANDIAKVYARLKTVEDENENLRKDCVSYQNERSALATTLDRVDRQCRKELSEKQAYRRDVEILKVRCKMAENELFNVKTKLFSKIHEHEAITPNDHRALPAVLPSILFDVNGEIV